jgi:uncharacterized protein YdaU (DUF1376 family)
LEKISPAFQFYARTYLSDPNQAGMALEETGAYIRLICFEWGEQGKGIPDDPVRCARMVGATPEQMSVMWPSLRRCFEPHPSAAGQLVHPRCELERAKQAEFSAIQRAKGLASGLVRKAGNRGSTAVKA